MSNFEVQVILFQCLYIITTTKAIGYFSPWICAKYVSGYWFWDCGPSENYLLDSTFAKWSHGNTPNFDIDGSQVAAVLDDEQNYYYGATLTSTMLTFVVCEMEAVRCVNNWGRLIAGSLSCYQLRIMTSAVDYSGAKEVCVTKDTWLVTLETEEEWVALKNVLQQQKTSMIAAGIGPTPSPSTTTIRPTSTVLPVDLDQPIYTTTTTERPTSKALPLDEVQPVHTITATEKSTSKALPVDEDQNVHTTITAERPTSKALPVDQNQLIHTTTSSIATSSSSDSDNTSAATLIHTTWLCTKFVANIWWWDCGPSENSPVSETFSTRSSAEELTGDLYHALVLDEGKGQSFQPYHHDQPLKSVICESESTLCRNSWVRLNYSSVACYRVVRSSVGMGYLEAHSLCLSDKSWLLTIETVEEWQAIVNFTQEQLTDHTDTSYTTLPDQGTNHVTTRIDHMTSKRVTTRIGTSETKHQTKTKTDTTTKMRTTQYNDATTYAGLEVTSVNEVRSTTPHIPSVKAFESGRENDGSTEQYSSSDETSYSENHFISASPEAENTASQKVLNTLQTRVEDRAFSSTQNTLAESLATNLKDANTINSYTSDTEVYETTTPVSVINISTASHDTLTTGTAGESKKSTFTVSTDNSDSTPSSISSDVTPSSVSSDVTVNSSPITTPPEPVVRRTAHPRKLEKVKLVSPMSLKSDDMDPDKRPFAIAVGSFAVLVVAAFVVSVFLLDLSTYVRDFKRMKRNVHSFFRYHQNYSRKIAP